MNLSLILLCGVILLFNINKAENDDKSLDNIENYEDYDNMYTNYDDLNDVSTEDDEDDEYSDYYSDEEERYLPGYRPPSLLRCRLKCRGKTGLSLAFCMHRCRRFPTPWDDKDESTLDNTENYDDYDSDDNDDNYDENVSDNEEFRISRRFLCFRKCLRLPHKKRLLCLRKCRGKGGKWDDKDDETQQDNDESTLDNIENYDDYDNSYIEELSADNDETENEDNEEFRVLPGFRPNIRKCLFRCRKLRGIRRFLCLRRCRGWGGGWDDQDTSDTTSDDDENVMQNYDDYDSDDNDENASDNEEFRISRRLLCFRKCLRLKGKARLLCLRKCRGKGGKWDDKDDETQQDDDSSLENIENYDDYDNSYIDNEELSNDNEEISYNEENKSDNEELRVKPPRRPRPFPRPPSHSRKCILRCRKHRGWRRLVCLRKCRGHLKKCFRFCRLRYRSKPARRACRKRCKRRKKRRGGKKKDE